MTLKVNVPFGTHVAVDEILVTSTSMTFKFKFKVKFKCKFKFKDFIVDKT